MTAVLTVALLFVTPVAPASVGVERVQPQAGSVTALRLDPALWKNPLTKETPWPTVATKASAVSAVTSLRSVESSSSSLTVTDSAVTGQTATVALLPAVSVSSTVPTPPPPPPLTPIETALQRLTELGATPYQIRTFGCLAWFESSNNPGAISATDDHGLFQIHRRFHAWRWAGRDIYDPIVNAEVAWDIYRESGFRAWTTAWRCV